MPYTQKDLNEQYRFIERIRFRDGTDVNLATVQELLQDECDGNGIPVAFHNDVLKTGGVLNKQVEDVLVLYNTEHPNDYLQLLIRVTHQGKYAFLDTFSVGKSKNIRSANLGIASTAVRVFNSLSGQGQKLEAEQNYYTILRDCLMNIVS